MASFNKIILAGNLTRDPELLYTATGTAVCNIGLAVNDRWTGADGEKHERVLFIDVTCWGKLAENVEHYMLKGSPVLVDGRLQQDDYENAGVKVRRHIVVAENVNFLGAPTTSNAASAQKPAAAKRGAK